MHSKRTKFVVSGKNITRRRSHPMKKVSQKSVTPAPALDVSNTWRPGDVVEVFDENSWKIAVLSQVLGNKYFLVRPLGSSSEFKVSKANIRERTSWKHNDCDAIGKDSCNWDDVEFNIKYSRKQRSLQISTNLGANDVDNVSCSVGSCSIASNDMEESPLRPPRDHVEDNDCDFSYTESVLDMKKDKKNKYVPAKEELEAEVHKLELHAYRCTMEALHASGPLSWEKEDLVTNLRISLHISNDEHLSELRSLISSNTIIPSR